MIGMYRYRTCSGTPTIIGVAAEQLGTGAGDCRRRFTLFLQLASDDRADLISALYYCSQELFSGLRYLLLVDFP